MARKALATFGTGELGGVLDESLHTFREFGARHGYDVVVGAADEAHGRSIAWAKVPLIRRLLDFYDFVLWLDADTIVLDASDDPAELLSPDYFQALVRYTWFGQQQPCTGVWVLASDERSKRFIDELWSFDDYHDEHPWEQAGVMKLLGWSSIWPGRIGSETDWMRGTLWLDHEWDSIPILAPRRRLEACRIRHHAATPNHIRRKQMRTERHALATARSRGPARLWHATCAQLGGLRWRLDYAPETTLRLRRAARRLGRWVAARLSG